MKNIKSVLESLLFVGGESISVVKLAGILKCKKEEIEKQIEEMMKDYKNRNSGIFLIRKEGKVQMITNPDNALFVDDLIKGELQGNLSKSALEVLSIIAYRGPIGRANIEAIRGVNSSFLIRNLLLRGLIEKMENPDDSRGYLYKISFDFMKKIGISTLEELPDYENLSKDERLKIVVPEKIV